MLASAQFVMVLDTSVMNVAISQIVEDLDTTIQGVQTAITLYTLVMAAFMLLGAKLGDILGRNRAFAIGLAIYGAGSLTTALSPNLGRSADRLVGGRGVRRGARDPRDRGAHRRQLRGPRARARLRAARRRRRRSRSPRAR
jgi:MFS family permease